MTIVSSKAGEGGGGYHPSIVGGNKSASLSFSY